MKIKEKEIVKKDCESGTEEMEMTIRNEIEDLHKRLVQNQL